MDRPPQASSSAAASSLTLRLQALPLRSSLAVGATSTEHILVRIQAPSQSKGPLPRLTAVLVLDISGSMKGIPLMQVRDSVARLASILGDQDALGVVAFSTGATTVTPIRGLSEKGARRAVQQAVESLVADGHTNISAGLSHAALMFPARGADERQLMLLLSDGQPNVGTKTAPGLAGEVALCKSRGVVVSTLGFGAQHNEDILLAISDTGGGRYFYIKDPLMAAPAFARALGAQRDVVAEDVQLTLLPGPGVEILRILGDARTSFGESGLRVNLADLLLGEEVNVVAELKVQSRREVGRWTLLRAALTAKAAGGSREPIVLREEVAVNLAAGGPGPADTGVLEIVAMANAAEQRKRARAMSDRRDFPAASTCLRQALEALRVVHGGLPKDGTALRDVYETLLDDLQVAEKAPDPAEYSILRKAQLDYQSMITNFGQAGAGAGVSPSAKHLVIKLQSTHGAVPRARLVCVEGQDRGKSLELGAECRIGRGKDNDLAVADDAATRHHALIQWVGSGFVAHDLGSSNGTFVNGQHIVDDHLLKDGDVLTVGKTRLRFERLDHKVLAKDL